MRRADRLFRIIEYLKARRHAVKAADLAEELDVCSRTIYRDMQDLALSGVPIIGEAGVGYMLDRQYMLRPLMLSIEEIDALTLGAQMVQSWGDKEISKSIRGAMDKICSILPQAIRVEITETFLLSFQTQGPARIAIDFTALRKSIRAKNIVKFNYIREDGQTSSRSVKPLCLVFFAPVWVLLGWCEQRKDFRNFRIDRMSALAVMKEKYIDQKGQRLSDYKKMMNVVRP